MQKERLVFRIHAIQRMAERGISLEEVRTALAGGEIIEDYPDDTPYPSRLILGWAGMRSLHVVAATDTAARETIIITVYEPDPDQWEPDLKRRRK